MPARSRLLPVLVFLAAFLLFTAQPLLGRRLLPSYGGGFVVWTSCLVFFQAVVLAGYAYAHALRLRSGRWHLLLAALAALVLPLHTPALDGAGGPVASVVATLAAGIGPPAIALSATAILAQAWLARSDRDDRRTAYRLYAASSAGSLLALAVYPFVVEPLCGLRLQEQMWTGGYVVFLVLLAVTAPAAGTRRDPAAASEARPAPVRLAYWFVLAMGSCTMLMAVTNAIASEAGSVPLSWTAPLGLYLLSFVVAFGRRPAPAILGRLWPEASALALAVLADAVELPGWWSLAPHLLALFAVSLAAHRELHRDRPPAHALTTFYVVIATGGLAGGVFVGVIAPVAFERLTEYPLGIAMVAVALAIGRRDAAVPWMRAHRAELVVRLVAAAAAAIALRGWFAADVAPHATTPGRNHYGLYAITETPASAAGPAERHFLHNGTLHGFQVLDGPARREPTGYYHRASPLGDVLGLVPPPRRVAVIGLGVGAIAAHLRPSDDVVFYELDADVVDVARSSFTFLADTPARARVVTGDARIELSRDANAPDGAFDLLVVDAFSGDAIPTHLLTLEALQLYADKLAPDGVIALHITNRFYDLRPVLHATADAAGLRGASKIRADAEVAPLELPSRWLVLTRGEAALPRLVDHGWTPLEDEPPGGPVWIDDHASVLPPLLAGL